ncbi:MAG: hypothetical protein IJE08_13455 [Clostridia bacterium]|nr:hypothetical protein [Clostridia bacterium]
MSVIIVVTADGRIVEEMIGYASYRSPKGMTIKPQTDAEMQRWRQISANAYKIQELKQAMAQLDAELQKKELADDLAALEDKRNQRIKIAGEIQRKENFNQAAQTMQRLKERAAELKEILVSLPGMEEESPVDVDEYTKGGLSKISAALGMLSDSFLSDEPEHVKHVMQQLVKMEEELEKLPDAAKDAFVRHMVRLELSDNVIDKLTAAGWNVQVKAKGDAYASTMLSADNADGDHAELVVNHNCEIWMDTPLFSESARNDLKSLVLDTLEESGFTSVKAKCMSDEPPQAPRASTMYGSSEEERVKEQLS